MSNTGIISKIAGGFADPIPITVAAMQALVTAGTVLSGQWYRITNGSDPGIGAYEVFTQGTTATAISSHVEILTTHSSRTWAALYSLGANRLEEVTDEFNNRIITPYSINNFTNYGNAFVRGCTVDNSRLDRTGGNVVNCQIYNSTLTINNGTLTDCTISNTSNIWYQSTASTYDVTFNNAVWKINASSYLRRSTLTNCTQQALSFQMVNFDRVALLNTYWDVKESAGTWARSMVIGASLIIQRTNNVSLSYSTIRSRIYIRNGLNRLRVSYSNLDGTYILGESSANSDVYYLYTTDNSFTSYFMTDSATLRLTSSVIESTNLYIDSSDFTISRCSIGSGSRVYVTGSDDTSLYFCTFTNLGTVRFLNSTFARVYASQIEGYSSNLRITNCVNPSLTHGVYIRGLNFTSSRVTITNSAVHLTRGTISGYSNLVVTNTNKPPGDQAALLYHFSITSGSRLTVNNNTARFRYRGNNLGARAVLSIINVAAYADYRGLVLFAGSKTLNAAPTTVGAIMTNF